MTTVSGDHARFSPLFRSTLATGIFAAMFGVGAVPDQARALTLETVGGTNTTISGIFDPDTAAPLPFGVGSSVTMFDATNAATGGLKVDPTTDVRILFTYIGKEAGNTNLALNWGDDTTPMFSTESTAIGATVEKTFPSLGPAPALIPFVFRTLAEITGGVVEQGINGGPIDGSLYLAFTGLFDHLIDGKIYQSVYALFGDGAGDGTPDDMDDMIVQITAISAVPIPGALLLFGSGLAGLGLFVRLRNRKPSSILVETSGPTPA